MQKVISILLVIVGIIHLLPVSGVLGAERLSALYGLSIQEPNIAILMRHRAVLFGLLGVFFIYAAFQPTIQPLAFMAGFVSVASFIAIAWSVGGYNDAVGRVFMVDLIALGCLVVATMLYFVVQRQR